MATYEYGRIEVLARELGNAGVPPEVRDRILEGGEAILKRTTPEVKADWLRQAMLRMDALLDEETRHAVREACACCLGGERGKQSRAIGKRGGSLEERVAAANEAKFVFGHSVTLQEDGRVLVCFAPDGLDHYRCSCLPKAKGSLPISYCYCCGGHAKHHLQNALGRTLKVEVLSSALSSGSTQPCRFLFSLVD